MLQTLHIKNFALIDDLVIPWKAGLNVLTGETGAGKSIIVDAMSLLLGERASGTFIRKGAASADIEALFDIMSCTQVRETLESMELDSSSDELLLRRVISAEGKSRCYLNGSVVTLNLLSKVGDLLVDMHGQHEHQSLMSPGKHLALLDAFGGLGADVAFIRQHYKELMQRASLLERLAAKEGSRSRRVSELQEELDLLDGADLKEGEDKELRSRRNVMANFEKIHRLASNALDMLSGGETYEQPLMDTWNAIMQALNEMAKVDHTLEESTAGYDELRFKFAELAETLQSYSSRLEYDPSELDAIEKRLETISKLKRRHDCDSLEELIGIRERMREEYSQLTGSSGEKMKLEREVGRLRYEIGNAASILSHKRGEVANRLEKKVELHLRELGMKKAKFVVLIEQEETPSGLIHYEDKRWKLWSTGMDKVEFLFSANVGEPPRPLRAIASGGEISRIMLAIRTILAETDEVPVIIFDEIDVGVGADMGMPIAGKLHSVSSSHQVICVTHLPHIAATADNHILVDKLVSSGRTRTDVSFPTGRERIREIARMLGGKPAAETSLKHAKELLTLSQKGR